ncbi:MAG: hypothetical protein ABIT36_05185, partial [Steroidobacteraceae bacterium]
TADAPLRLAADARITSVVESNDKNLRGTQYVAWSKLPPGQLRQRLCSRARTLGWQVRDCEAAAIEMSRSTSALVVTVVATASSSGGVSGLRSVVVMNHMQSEQ